MKLGLRIHLEVEGADDQACRVELFRALHALADNLPPHWTPVLNMTGTRRIGECTISEVEDE